MTTPPITRRRVAAGAAWTIPAALVSVAAPAAATSGGGVGEVCPTLAESQQAFIAETFLKLALYFEGADVSWVATLTGLSPFPDNRSGFFTLPPASNLASDGGTRFDLERTYRGGADEEFTFTFTLTKGDQVCTYEPITVQYYWRA